MSRSLTRITQLDEPADKNAPLGSRPWAVHFVRIVKHQRQAIEQDVSILRRGLMTLQEGEAWKAYGLLSWELFCEQELDLDADALARVMAAKSGTPLKRVLGGHGEYGRGRPKPEADRVYHINSKGGTRTVYLLARLERDHPALAAQVRAGQLSAHAAAIRAGFLTKTIRVPLDVPRAAAILRRHFGAQARALGRGLLTPRNGSC